MNARGVRRGILFFAFLSLEFTPSAESYTPGQEVVPPCNAAQFKRVQRDAARGLANAQTALADRYGDGRCVPQDYAQAALWYRRGAEQGNADAQFALAMFLLEGKEVAQDAAGAAAWFGRAAEQNHDRAQYALGSLYVQGRGLPRDLVHGYMWIRISSPSADRHTQDVLAEIAKSMSRSDTDRAEAAAVSWIAAHSRSHSQSMSKK